MEYKSGKFIVAVSATDFKSEIVSEEFYVCEISDDIIKACEAILKDEYSCYSLSNFETNVVDIETLYKNFSENKYQRRKIDSVVYNMKRAKREIEEKERQEYLRLKKKFEGK